MTIEDLLRVVREETGKEATADSKLSDIVADSLEFTNLIAAAEAATGSVIPAYVEARLITVGDLYHATQGKTEFNMQDTAARGASRPLFHD